MNDEIPTPPPGETQIPPAPEAAPIPAAPAAPPPAARLVVEGVKSEREIELERQLESVSARTRLLETTVSERERDLQRLTAPPSPVKRPKRKPNWSDPVFGNGEDACE